MPDWPHVWEQKEELRHRYWSSGRGGTRNIDETVKKTELLNQGDAFSDTLCVLDPDLARLIELKPSLPDLIHRAFLTSVGSITPPSGTELVPQKKTHRDLLTRRSHFRVWRNLATKKRCINCPAFATVLTHRTYPR